MELGTDLSEQALLIYTFIKIRLIFWGTDFSDVLDMMLFSVLSLLSQLISTFRSTHTLKN